jgi:multiple sugar transport system ATP-binding protein
MRAELKELHQRMQTTFVYVTHDQAEALTLADCITVMRNGVVQQVDAPDGIYNRPINRFVAGFLGSPQMNFVEREIADRDRCDPARQGGANRNWRPNRRGDRTAAAALFDESTDETLAASA